MMHHYSLIVAGAVGVASACLSLAGCHEERYMGRTVSAWTHELQSEHDFKRRRACEALAALGPKAASAVDELVLLLDDVNPGVQAFARVALTRIGSASVSDLEEALGHPQPMVRLHAGAALVGIQAGHQKGGKAVIDAFKGLGNADLAKEARRTMVRMGTGAVPLLVPMLKDSYAPVREQAAVTLGMIGVRAQKSMHALAAVIETDTDTNVRREAVRALAMVGEKDVVRPILEKATKDTRQDVAFAAARMLVYIGARERATGYAVAEQDTEVKP